ncbi:MAG: AAA family ATPase [Hyphomicrobiaceae bacterium]|nr:AAA family ATPase [Hyphomicrobiaceae bacterium]
MADLTGIVLRGWRLVLCGLLVGALAAYAVSFMVPASYKATARILIDNSLTRILYSNKVGDEPTLDLAATSSQIYVITSESVLLSVVRSQNLVADEDFDFAPGTQAKGVLQAATEAVKEWLGIGTPANVPATQVAKERQVLDELFTRLDVVRADVPNVIDVTFASRDPEKAASIANAVAEAYLASVLDNKSNSSRISNKLMQERLTELKQRAADAERSVQEYKLTHNLLTGAREPLSSDQIRTLNNHLTEARVATANAKARLERAENAHLEAERNGVVEDNSIILRLREQYLDYSTRVTEIEGRVGKDHLAVAKMRKRMEDLRNAIVDEQKRITERLATEFELAKARQEQLAVALTSAAGEEGSNSQAHARMRELESSAETLRNLHNAILQRYSEAAKQDDASTSAQEARIITKARPPLRKDSSKKRLVLMGGCLALGLLLGIGGAIARDFPFGVFRTADQVVKATGLYSAVLPSVESRDPGRPVNDHVLNAPYSRFAEALRNIWALISAANRQNGSKIIGVVSSVAKEGKTTVACNLASLLSVTTKSRVLLIDGDAHRRSLTERMTPDAKKGLLEALKDPEHLGTYVTKIQRSGLHVLPCVLTDRIPNAAEVLGSGEMERLLEVAYNEYDLVVIEIAPIVSVIDVKMLERFIDRFILVVEWGKTSRRLVNEALAEAPAIRDRILCVVLNKVSPNALKSIEYYRGKRYGAYYQD